MEALLQELPWWLTLENVLRFADSKIFSAIYWGAAAVVAVIGFIARMHYRDRNLKRLLDAYIAKAARGEGRERATVKEVISRAIRKARGLTPSGATVPFDVSDVFQEAARLCAQRQPHRAIELLRREAEKCESTIEYARHQVRLAQQRAATAHLEIGFILRDQGRGVDAIEAFTEMLRVNPEDLDALRMRGLQYRELERYDDAIRDFNTVLYCVQGDAAAVADTKRELALVHVARKRYADAFAALDEALKIEVERGSQRGTALTHESIGGAKAARGWRQQAEEAYTLALKIFRDLGDNEGVERVAKLLGQLKEAREEEARRRREGRATDGQPEGAPLLH
jgi:tetratricopeptide (TPR) repeat protein